MAAGCQLPLRNPVPGSDPAHKSLGMRHRAALTLSEETDAVVLVVSEETGRISIALAGKFEAVPRDNLARRLVDLLSMAPHADRGLARVRRTRAALSRKRQLDFRNAKTAQTLVVPPAAAGR